MAKNWKDEFGGYLKTESLNGRAVPAVITQVDLHTIKGQDGKPDERKLAATFKNSDKLLILNKTRCEQLESIFGTSDYESWAGPVMLVPGTTKFGGKTVGCIDVKPRMSAAVAAPAPVSEPDEDVTEDSIPFAWMMPLMLPSLLAIGGMLA